MDTSSTPDERWLVHGDVTKVIIDQFFELRSLIGPDLLEAVYANGMAVLLQDAGLRVDREVRYDVLLRGRVIGRYRADMVVGSNVLVEVKVASRLVERDAAQVLNYLRISELDVGIVLNFGARAEFKRVVATRVSDAAFQRRRKR